MPAIRTSPRPPSRYNRPDENPRMQGPRAQQTPAQQTRAQKAQEPQPMQKTQAMQEPSASESGFSLRSDFQRSTAASKGYSPSAVAAGLMPDGSRPAGSGGYSAGAVAAGLMPDGSAPQAYDGYSLGADAAAGVDPALERASMAASNTTAPQILPANDPMSGAPQTLPANDPMSGMPQTSPTGAPMTAAPQSPPTPKIPTEDERKAIVENAKTNTTEEQQRAFLAGLGIPEKHLNDTYGDKLAHAFGETVDALLQPGEHKRSLKIDNQYDLNVEVGDNLELKGASAMQDRDSSFFGKVLDKVAPFAGAIGAALGPVTGGVSTVIGAAIGAVQAVRTKDPLGFVSSVAGGIGGFLGQAKNLTTGLGALAASKGAQTVATAADLISRGANVVKGGLEAFRTGNLGGIVDAVANGVGLVGEGFGSAGEQFKGIADNLGRASRIALNGNKAIQALNAGDYLGAAQNILGAGAELTKPSPTPGAPAPTPGTMPTPTLSDRLAQASNVVGTINKAKTAFETGNYPELLGESLRLAAQVSGNPTIDRAADIAKPSAELINAIQSGNVIDIAKAAKKVYDETAKIEQLNLPKNPLDLAKDVLGRIAA
jgi:hypothetical protein